MSPATSKPTKASKASNAKAHQPQEKPRKVKTSRNWYLMWTKIDSTSSAPIYIKRWVRLEESEAPNPQPEPSPAKTEPKSFACRLDDCDKVFMDSASLKKHLASHGEKLFDCPFEGCGKKFVDKSKLKRHQLVHTGERPYGCEICSKKFSLDFNLRTHIRTHTGLKPYACRANGCQKRFTQSSNLVAHEKTHARGDDKPEKPEKLERSDGKPESKRKRAEKGSDQTTEFITDEKKFGNIEQDMIDSIGDAEMQDFLREEIENLKLGLESNGLGRVLLRSE